MKKMYPGAGLAKLRRPAMPPTGGRLTGGQSGKSILLPKLPKLPKPKRA